MTAQADDLFGDVGLIRENRGFGEQPALVGVRALKQLFYALGKPLVVLAVKLRSARFDPVDETGDKPEPRDNILRELRSFNNKTLPSYKKPNPLV